MTGSEQQTHRSIGEVLALIQEDYPDVTISKIRFLESQGLVAPERTASGFRKFYDSDIQRLRWILRKQSDQFLPLKVIKKMLDEGADTSVLDDSETQQTLWQLDEPTTDASTQGAGRASAGHVSGAKGDRDVADGDSAGRRSPRPDVIVATRPGRPEVRASHDGSTSGRGPGGGRTRQPSPTHPSIVGRNMSRASLTPDEGAGSSNGGTPEAALVQPEGREATKGGREMTDGDGSRGIMTPADIVAALQEDPRPAGLRGAGAAGGDEVRASGTGAASTSRTGQFSVEDLTDLRDRGDFLSVDEVCEMFDIEPSLLDDLEKYGLIEPRRYGGTTSFDGSDVEIIGVSVRYASLGVEPRHLRMYKIAAEREAGFVEQLVLPILKQRNPTAKQSATERCSQLATMGDELHNLILRRHLRNLLDNR